VAYHHPPPHTHTHTHPHPHTHTPTHNSGDSGDSDGSAGSGGNMTVVTVVTVGGVGGVAYKSDCLEQFEWKYSLKITLLEENRGFSPVGHSALEILT
jgi:hypothetical protein